MNLKAIIEALIFVSERPLRLEDLMAVFDRSAEGPKPAKSEVLEILKTIEEEGRERGVELISVAGGYEFRTRPDLAPWIRLLDLPKPQRLSTSAVETLSIIAYKQPVTRADVESIRGVDVGGVLKTLLDRELIRIIGRREEAGRPMLYATSAYFLTLFGLKDLSELPPLQELEEMIHARGDEASAERPKAQEISVSDLVPSLEEISEIADEDREVLADLEQKIQNMKDLEKSVQ